MKLLKRFGMASTENDSWVVETARGWCWPSHAGGCIPAALLSARSHVVSPLHSALVDLHSPGAAILGDCSLSVLLAALLGALQIRPGLLLIANERYPVSNNQEGIFH